MSIEGHPAAENVHYLRQGIELIDRLEQRLYTEEDGSLYRSVGSQFRHCVDFYESFLRGLPESRIDYDFRERDPRVEIDRAHASARMGHIAETLTALDPSRVDDELTVRVEGAATATRAWCRSSVLRELQFLNSHTIHHYALIVTLLRLRGMELDPALREFGVAPSTLAYLSRNGS